MGHIDKISSTPFTHRLVGRFGLNRWSALAAEGFPSSADGSISARTGKQCRERWLNVLSDPTSYRKPWSSEDDDQLEARESHLHCHA